MLILCRYEKYDIIYMYIYILYQENLTNTIYLIFFNFDF